MRKSIRKAPSLMLSKSHLRSICKFYPGELVDVLIALCDLSDAIEDGKEFEPTFTSKNAEFAFDLLSEQVIATTEKALERSKTNSENRKGTGKEPSPNDNDRQRSSTIDNDRQRSSTTDNDRAINIFSHSDNPSVRPYMNDHSYVPAPAEDGTDGRVERETEPDEGNAAFSRKQAAALFEAEGVKLTPGVWNELEHTFPPSDRRGAVDALLGNIRAATQPIDNVPAFLMHVLRRWKSEGVQTVKQARASDDRFLHQTPPQPSQRQEQVKPIPVDTEFARKIVERNKLERERQAREHAEREARRNGGDKQ